MIGKHNGDSKAPIWWEELETWLWSPLLCTVKAHMRVDIQNYAKVRPF